MGGFGFPLGLFGLVVGDGAFFSTNHCAIIDPANGIDHADNFGVIEDNTDILVPLIKPVVPLHGHIIKRNNNLFAILPIKRLNLEHITRQVIDILFFPCMRKATQVTTADNINVILGYKEPLGVLELLDINFIVIVEIKTGEIVSSE